MYEFIPINGQSFNVRYFVISKSIFVMQHLKSKDFTAEVFFFQDIGENKQTKIDNKNFC